MVRVFSDHGQKKGHRKEDIYTNANSSKCAPLTNVLLSSGNVR